MGASEIPKRSKSPCKSCLLPPPPLPSSPLQSAATCLSMWFPVLPTQTAMPSPPPAESVPPFTAGQHLCPAFRRPVLTMHLTLPDSHLHAHLHRATRPVLGSYGAHPNYTTRHNKSDSLTLNFSKGQKSKPVLKIYLLLFCPISIWDCACGGCSRTSVMGRAEVARLSKNVVINF